MRVPLSLLAASVLSLSLAQADEIRDYDRLASGNVTVAVRVSSGNFQPDGSVQVSQRVKQFSGAFTKRFEIRISSTARDYRPATLEFYIVRKIPGKPAHGRLVEKIETSDRPQVIEIECNDQKLKGVSADEIDGWFVRMIRDNAIVGFEASAPKYSGLGSVREFVNFLRTDRNR